LKYGAFHYSAFPNLVTTYMEKEEERLLTFSFCYISAT